MRKLIDMGEEPRRRIVLQVHFNEDIEYDPYWALIEPDAPVEVYSMIPGFNVDLYIETTTMSLLGILLGRTTIVHELDLGELFLSGDALLAPTMDRWLPVSDYARFDGILPLASEGRSVSICAYRQSAHTHDRTRY